MVGKAVIFAGGMGTRLGEETEIKPMPLVETGGHPILSHVMEIHSKFTTDHFAIGRVYESYLIEECLSNDCRHMVDVGFEPAGNSTGVRGFIGGRNHLETPRTVGEASWTARR